MKTNHRHPQERKISTRGRHSAAEHLGTGRLGSFLGSQPPRPSSKNGRKLPEVWGRSRQSGDSSGPASQAEPTSPEGPARRPRPPRPQSPPPASRTGPRHPLSPPSSPPPRPPPPPPPLRTQAHALPIPPSAPAPRLPPFRFYFSFPRQVGRVGQSWGCRAAAAPPRPRPHPNAGLARVRSRFQDTARADGQTATARRTDWQTRQVGVGREQARAHTSPARGGADVGTSLPPAPPLPRARAAAPPPARRAPCRTWPGAAGVWASNPAIVWVGRISHPPWSVKGRHGENPAS